MVATVLVLYTLSSPCVQCPLPSPLPGVDIKIYQDHVIRGDHQRPELPPAGADISRCQYREYGLQQTWNLCLTIEWIVDKLNKLSPPGIRILVCNDLL